MEIVLFLKNLLVSSGTAWVLWLLIALSVGSVGVIVRVGHSLSPRQPDRLTFACHNGK